MNNRIFSKELAYLRESFNSTFANRRTFNIKARQNCLLAILHLHLVQVKIARQKNSTIRLQTIQDFLHKFRILKTFFNQQKEVTSAQENTNKLQAA